jgi:suppressor for copper-sensitivity B
MRRKGNSLATAVFLGLLLSLAAVSADAAEPAASDWARTDHAEVRLVAATTATGAAETLRFGLQFRLQPGWKIYWRSPGDAGFPPKPDWSGSRNLAAAAFRWPAPERFELFGLDTFGYGGEVVLPIDARVERKGGALAANLALDYLVCEKICIPYQATLALELPAGPAQPSAHAHLIDRFAARVPGDGAGAGVAIESAAWRGGRSPTIRVIARSSLLPFDKPDVIVELPPDGAPSAGFGRPDVDLAEGGRLAVLRIPVRADAAAKAGLDLAGTRVTLTLVDGVRAMERTVVLEPGLPMPEPISIGLAAVLGIALLGGLILNLMPCVLPVLSIKLLNFVGQGGAARSRIRRNFLASAAGIVVSFVGLAVVLIGLKGAGATVGWGIQFQQPAFLIFMALVVTLFAANLWGWFEIRLPGAVSVPAGSAPQEERARGAFFTGVLATLLATPCSAPFVGTAVGFALAQGPAEILAVFVALGGGLAAPYILVAAVPGLAARMPRPGLWMVRLRAVLGLALLATALWLLSVLAAQVNLSGAIVVGLGLAAILGILWSVRAAGSAGGWAGRVAVLALALLVFVVPDRFASPTAMQTAAAPTAPGAWHPFDVQAIETLVAQGRVVFVDVTADWCITCQVNKTAVVSRGEVAARLADGRVVPMRADWTRPNDEIARYLANFGRYGIPFNVVYGPAAPEGIPLPEILTRDAVLAAFEQALGPRAQAGRGPRGG